MHTLKNTNTQNKTYTYIARMHVHVCFNVYVKSILFKVYLIMVVSLV